MPITHLFGNGMPALNSKIKLYFFLILSQYTYSNHYILTSPAYNPGFFSVFNTVLGCLQDFDQGLFQGLTIDFQDKGLYYDPLYGPNWWHYYFEPINISNTNSGQTTVKKFPLYKKIIFAFQSQFDIDRQEGYFLIGKYIHLTSHIQDQISNFVREHFKDSYVIGVHYRGTDKVSEAPAVTYELVAKEVNKAIEAYHGSDYKIFVATDDGLFFKYMVGMFPNKVCGIDTYRSEDGTPVHIQKNNNYKKGQDALLDCILLSKTDLIIKCASNLSDTSLKFNPNIPVIHLNTSYSERTIYEV